MDCCSRTRKKKNILHSHCAAHSSLHHQLKQLHSQEVVTEGLKTSLLLRLSWQTHKPGPGPDCLEQAPAFTSHRGSERLHKSSNLMTLLSRRHTLFSNGRNTGTPATLPVTTATMNGILEGDDLFRATTANAKVPKLWFRSKYVCYDKTASSILASSGICPQWWTLETAENQQTKRTQFIK